MSRLANKHVLVGVTGGIAAYKAADLVRRLMEAGAAVRVVMTRNATQFVTPLTMQAVSGEPVYVELLDTETDSGMGHIELARWADVIIVVPASANVIARLAHGMADDLLTTLCLASQAPVMVAPAMNQIMWLNPATQANLAILESRGIARLGPADGSQACGEVGPGRLLEPTQLVEALENLITSNRLTGHKMVITAGPTYEAIDPVRMITNHSSGKMGYALAQAATEAGAEVVLVSGPTNMAPPYGTRRISVISAQEMYNAVMEEVNDADLFLAVAAVADYRPIDPKPEKIKKDADRIQLTLTKNRDIVSEVAQLHKRPFTVGFAAETQDLERHAREKLIHKRLDMVIANRIDVPGIGFGSDENAVVIMDRHGSHSLEAMPKSRLARILIDEIADRYHAKNTSQDTRRTHR